MTRHQAPGATVALAAVVLGLAACSGGGEATASRGSTVVTTVSPVTTQMLDGVRGLCAARDEAGTDVKLAGATFYDRSHDTLHTIARDLEPLDRALAARLLEAKQAVEADLSAVSPEADTGPPAATLVADLDRLVEATVRGLARLSITADPCP